MDESYTAAGWKPDRKRGSRLAKEPRIHARVTFLRDQLAKETREREIFTQSEAERICAAMCRGEHGAEPQHRIAAMKLFGQWAGWEQGTAADRKAAEALGGVAQMVERIRSAGRL